MIDSKISDEQIQMALLDFCRKNLTSNDLQFGVWPAGNVIKHLHVKNVDIKKNIVRHSFVFAAESMNKDLKEDKIQQSDKKQAEKKQRELIKQIKLNIKQLFAKFKVSGDMKIYKINSKSNNRKFFIVPFDVPNAVAHIEMQISF